jgi:hypothetical protein
MSQSLTKCRIVNVRTRFAHEVMVNPATVSFGHGWNFGSHTPHGMSHPVISGGTGSEGTISFQLVVDGERGRLDQRRAGVSGSLSIKYELDYYESLTLPEEPPADAAAGVAAGGSPPRLILTLGTLFRRIEVRCTSFSANVTLFSPQLDPIRATIDLSFVQYRRKALYSSELSGDTTDDQDRDASGGV